MMFTAAMACHKLRSLQWLVTSSGHAPRRAPGVFELKLTRHYKLNNFGQVINRVGKIADFGH